MRPASCRSLNRASTSEMSGLLRTATNATCGTRNSWISSSRFAFTCPRAGLLLIRYLLADLSSQRGRFNWINAVQEDDGNRCGCRLGCVSAAASPAKAAMTTRPDDAPDRRPAWKALKLTSAQPVVDHNILAFDIAGVLQTLRNPRRRIRETVRAFRSSEIRRPAAQAAARAPGAARRRRAAEQRDELAPSHPITSSARASSVRHVEPSVLAVLRFMTN